MPRETGVTFAILRFFCSVRLFDLDFRAGEFAVGGQFGSGGVASATDVGGFEMGDPGPEFAPDQDQVLLREDGLFASRSFVEARAEYERARGLASEMGWTDAVALVDISIANIDVLEGNPKNAEATLRRELVACKVDGECLKYTYARLLDRLIRLYLTDLGDKTSAHKLIQELESVVGKADPELPILSWLIEYKIIEQRK